MFLEYFTSVGKLKKTDAVLDVGSGYGRMAFPLTTYLDKTGSYQGIEIISKGVDYSKKEISTKYKNFYFQKIDVRNDLYNPQGKVEASEFKFPFKDNSFNFVFLTSVFTHMMRNEMENYASEIARVLKTNGRFFITFFLLNEESENEIREGNSKYTFKFENEGCRIEFEDLPGRVVAFRENEVRMVLKQNYLKIDETIQYGNWSGRKDFLSYQDIVTGSNIK